MLTEVFRKYLFSGIYKAWPLPDFSACVMDKSLAKPHLTEREIQILSLIARGMSSQQIALKLAISFETVKVHRRNMLKKARTHNTFELIRLAIQRKWI